MTLVSADILSTDLINIVARRGDSFSLTVEVNNGQIPFDFSGFDGKMQIKVRPSDNIRVILLFDSADSSMSFVDNRVILSKDGADMNISPGHYVYDCEVTKVNEVVTVFSGAFVVNNDVTRG